MNPDFKEQQPSKLEAGKNIFCALYLLRAAEEKAREAQDERRQTVGPARGKEQGLGETTVDRLKSRTADIVMSPLGFVEQLKVYLKPEHFSQLQKEALEIIREFSTIQLSGKKERAYPQAELFQMQIAPVRIFLEKLLTIAFQEVNFAKWKEDFLQDPDEEKELLKRLE